jgi:hypothetical protein
MRSARADPVDERRKIGNARNLAEVVAGAEDRRPQRRHLILERNPHRLGKAIRRPHDDVHDKFAPGQPCLLDLTIQFVYCLFDALGRVLAHAAALVEHAIDGRLAEAGLKRNLFDEKRVSHKDRLMGF